MDSLRSRLAALPRAAWILFAGTFVNRFGSFVIVFLVIYVTRLGFSATAAGFAAGAYGFGNVIASVAGGYLSDRFGRRHTIVLSMFSAAVMLVALSQARSYPAIVIFSILCGLTAELYRPASAALIADIVPVRDRVTAYAVYRLAINAGVALGPAIAGFLAERSFLYLFIADAVTCVAFGFIALTSLPEGSRAQRDTGDVARISWVTEIARDRRFMVFLGASLLMVYVFFQWESTFALQVVAEGFSLRVYGTLISFNAALVVLFEVPLAARVAGLDRQRVIAAGFAFVAAGFGVLSFPATIPLYVASVAIWTIGEMLSSPVSTAFVADLAPEHLRGRYMGAWHLTWSIGLMLGPTLGAFVYRWNATAHWAICGAVGIAAAAMILAIPRESESAVVLSS